MGNKPDMTAPRFRWFMTELHYSLLGFNTPLLAANSKVG
jgi:hypothetical protein